MNYGRKGSANTHSVTASRKYTGCFLLGAEQYKFQHPFSGGTDFFLCFFTNKPLGFQRIKDGVENEFFTNAILSTYCSRLSRLPL